MIAARIMPRTLNAETPLLAILTEVDGFLLSIFVLSLSCLSAAARRPLLGPVRAAAWVKELQRPDVLDVLERLPVLVGTPVGVVRPASERQLSRLANFGAGHVSQQGGGPVD